jgi:hypothetical protein
MKRSETVSREVMSRWQADTGSGIVNVNNA